MKTSTSACVRKESWIPDWTLMCFCMGFVDFCYLFTIWTSIWEHSVRTRCCCFLHTPKRKKKNYPSIWLCETV